MSIIRALLRAFASSSRTPTRALSSGAKRSFAPYPKRANPLSNRSTGNVSRFRRF